MKDTIEINLKSLTEKDRKKIREVLRYTGFVIPCEINDQALEDIDNFEEY